MFSVVVVMRVTLGGDWCTEGAPAEQSGCGVVCHAARAAVYGECSHMLCSCESVWLSCRPSSALSPAVSCVWPAQRASVSCGHCARSIQRPLRCWLCICRLVGWEVGSGPFAQRHTFGSAIKRGLLHMGEVVDCCLFTA